MKKSFLLSMSLLLFATNALADLRHQFESSATDCKKVELNKCSEQLEASKPFFYESEEEKFERQATYANCASKTVYICYQKANEQFQEEILKLSEAEQDYFRRKMQRADEINKGSEVFLQKDDDLVLADYVLESDITVSNIHSCMGQFSTIEQAADFLYSNVIQIHDKEMCQTKKSEGASEFCSCVKESMEENPSTSIYQALSCHDAQKLVDNSIDKRIEKFVDKSFNTTINSLKTITADGRPERLGAAVDPEASLCLPGQRDLLLNKLAKSKTCSQQSIDKIKAKSDEAFRKINDSGYTRALFDRFKYDQELSQKDGGKAMYSSFMDYAEKNLFNLQMKSNDYDLSRESQLTNKYRERTQQFRDIVNKDEKLKEELLKNAAFVLWPNTPKSISQIDENQMFMVMQHTMSGNLMDQYRDDSAEDYGAFAPMHYSAEVMRAMASDIDEDRNFKSLSGLLTKVAQAQKKGEAVSNFSDEERRAFADIMINDLSDFGYKYDQTGSGISVFIGLKNNVTPQGEVVLNELAKKVLAGDPPFNLPENFLELSDADKAKLMKNNFLNTQNELIKKVPSDCQQNVKELVQLCKDLDNNTSGFGDVSQYDRGQIQDVADALGLEPFYVGRQVDMLTCENSNNNWAVDKPCGINKKINNVDAMEVAEELVLDAADGVSDEITGYTAVYDDFFKKLTPELLQRSLIANGGTLAAQANVAGNQGNNLANTHISTTMVSYTNTVSHSELEFADIGLENSGTRTADSLAAGQDNFSENGSDRDQAENEGDNDSMVESHKESSGNVLEGAAKVDSTAVASQGLTSAEALEQEEIKRIDQYMQSQLGDSFNYDPVAVEEARKIVEQERLKQEEAEKRERDALSDLQNTQRSIDEVNAKTNIDPVVKNDALQELEDKKKTLELELELAEMEKEKAELARQIAEEKIRLEELKAEQAAKKPQPAVVTPVNQVAQAAVTVPETPAGGLQQFQRQNLPSASTSGTAGTIARPVTTDDNVREEVSGGGAYGGSGGGQARAIASVGSSSSPGNGISLQYEFNPIIDNGKVWEFKPEEETLYSAIQREGGKRIVMSQTKDNYYRQYLVDKQGRAIFGDDGEPEYILRKKLADGTFVFADDDIIDEILDTETQTAADPLLQPGAERRSTSWKDWLALKGEYIK